ncbi:MAG: histidinol-phosphate transaminase [Novosphingobium sp.]
MTIAISRRLMLAGTGAGSALALTGASRAALAASPSAEPEYGADAADVFGPPAGIAQLSRNENPFGPAPSALQAIARRFEGNAKIVELPRKGAKVKRVPLGADMGVDLAAMKAAVGPDVGLIHICNPNNPTAMSLDGDALRAFIRSIDPGIPILIDEAYMELTAKPEYTSMVDLLGERENLIITRTFSKIYGMAGLRLGYALTSPGLAETLRGYLMSFGGNTAGLAAGIASYNDKAFLKYSKDHVLEAREAIMAAVKSCGLTALPSDTNFVYVKVPDADALFKAMAEARVDVRPAYGKWKQWSRVSTGKMEDVQRYAKVLRAFYNA